MGGLSELSDYEESSSSLSSTSSSSLLLNKKRNNDSNKKRTEQAIRRMGITKEKQMKLLSTSTSNYGDDEEKLNTDTNNNSEINEESCNDEKNDEVLDILSIISSSSENSEYYSSSEKITESSSSTSITTTTSDDNDNEDEDEDEDVSFFSDSELEAEYERERRKKWMKMVDDITKPETSEVTLQNFDEKYLVSRLTALENLWTVKQNEKIDDIVRRTKENLKLDPDAPLTLADLHQLEKTYTRPTTYLNLKFLFANLKNSNHPRSGAYEIRFQNLLDIQYHAFRLLYNVVRIQQLSSKPEETIPSGIGILKFSHIEDIPEKHRFCILTKYFQLKLSEKNYRRYKKDVYAPIFSSEGYFTHAWQRVMSIREFVYSAICIDTETDIYILATSNGVRNLEDSIRFLCEFRTPYFPELQPNRYYISFRNGVYYLPTDTFYPYNVSKENPVTSSLDDSQHGQTALRLDRDIVSCNYIDQEFIHHWDKNCGNIKTPALSQILRSQEFTTDVREWIWALTGRAFYPLHGRNENWEVAVLLLGYAGTGKSSWLTAIRKVYPLNSIGILSNNIEKQWALSSLINKYVVIGFDINSNFKWDQAEFHSCAVGEEVSVARKFGDPIIEKFDSAIFMAANKMITTWMDDAGSLKRRLIVIPFNVYIPKSESDPHLNQKIYDQLGNFIQKANRYYIMYSDLYGNQDIWKVLPPFFEIASNENIKNTHPLQQFLDEREIVIRRKKSYIGFEEFKNCFFSWLQQIGRVDKPRWNKDFYMPVFDAQNIKLTISTKIDPRTGREVQKKWLEGITIREDYFLNLSSPHKSPSSKFQSLSSPTFTSTTVATNNNPNLQSTPPSYSKQRYYHQQQKQKQKQKRKRTFSTSNSSDHSTFISDDNNEKNNQKKGRKKRKRIYSSSSSISSPSLPLLSQKVI